MFFQFSFFKLNTLFTLKYELQILDDLIKDNNDSNNEVALVIENLKKNCFQINTEEATKLYIRNHQSELNHKKEIDSIYGKSDAILHFLEIVFNNYLDEKLPISDMGKHKLALKYADIIESTYPTLKSKLNKNLFNILSPLFEINVYKSITIYTSRFYSEFWDNWKQDFNILISSNDFETTFIKFLISNNFNSVHLFEYLKSMIISQIIEVFNPFQQEEILIDHFQIYNNIPVRKGYSFTMDYLELKPSLVDWLKQELKKCRKKQENFNPQQTNIIKEDTIKIETSLSVGQVAYFFKILVENGLITNKSHSNIIHFISGNFITKKSESVSFSSLKNKFYNIDDSTKFHIKGLLFKMYESI
ncbi:MAG: hypothetical protein RLZZ175_885 [Bacteroidota bacterium]